MQQTGSITTDETGTKIIEIDISKLENFTLEASEDALFGFSDLTQTVYPLTEGRTLILKWSHFTQIARTKRFNILRIYGKRKNAGSITFYWNRIERN